MKLIAFLLLTAAFLSPASAQTAKETADKCPTKKVGSRRLPDLNTPRSGHAAFCINGELTVAGGHTTGFVPTKTAEYFSDGEWHQVPMVYTHDGPFFVALKAGKVLIGGGFEKEFGIGQSFSTEFYNPDTHSFEGSSVLSTKRVAATAIETDSGRVVITGNWYEDDNLEIFDGQPLHTDGSSNFYYYNKVSQQRAMPYILRTAADNALIVGAYDTKGQPTDSIIADRLKGGPLRVPLFNKWRPLYLFEPYQMQDCFIGDEAKDYYAYLLPVADSTGRVAIAKVEGENIALLPTSHPVPMLAPNGRDSIHYRSIIADRQAQRAYLVGVDTCEIGYVLCIDYGKAQPAAPLTLCHTDPMPGFGNHHPVLTPEGDLAFLGGKKGINFNNYNPLVSAWLIITGSPEAAAAQGVTSRWHWLLLAVAGLLALCFVLYRLRTRHLRQRLQGQMSPTQQEAPSADSQDATLLSRLCLLMEKDALFRNSELKVGDVAVVLGTSSRKVSECIKAERGCSFADFVNNYRIDHAKQLLRQQPDIKVSEVWLSSGFSNEQTFYRIFKSLTGMTPNEWKNR